VTEPSQVAKFLARVEFLFMLGNHYDIAQTSEESAKARGFSCTPPAQGTADR